MELIIGIDHVLDKIGLDETLSKQRVVLDLRAKFKLMAKIESSIENFVDLIKL